MIIFGILLAILAGLLIVGIFFSPEVEVYDGVDVIEVIEFDEYDEL